MSELKNIQVPVERELREFESCFKKSLQSDIPLLGTILKFLYRTGGKQIRTLMVFLSAKMTGETNESSQLAACAIELLHTATLVHDDVVDESYERRGTFSVKALWKNKLAVLVGDYILAKGMLLMLDNRKYDFLHLISSAVKDMSEGETMQIKTARRLDIDEDTYFEIIRKKTASLLATSMAIGALSATTDKAVHEKMYKIGQDAGIAFQIKDDIMDYQARGVFTDKPVGNDIKEKKITLPLLYVLNNSSSVERRRILRIVKHNGNSPAVVQEIIRLVSEKGGIEYAAQKMEEFKDRAVGRLMEFEDSQARRAMIELMGYITTRRK